jgi:hypothetical protein
MNDSVTMPVAAVHFLRLLANRSCEHRRFKDGTCRTHGGLESTWCWPCRARLAVRGWNAAKTEWQPAPKRNIPKGALLMCIPPGAGKTEHAHSTGESR